MAKKSREEIDHYTLDQFEQERHLGIGHERTKNLGHDWRESEIEQNPAGRMVDYANNDVSKGVVRGPARSQSVYGKFRDPQSGIANERNLDRWSNYATAGSYRGGDGTGKDVTMRDQGRRSVPSEARNKDSDGYLESTKNWPSFDTGGADSGVGRLEKSRKY
jgi:hypothetical protein